MCEGCALQQKNPMSMKSHLWENPSSAWPRLHKDFAGPFLCQSMIADSCRSTRDRRT